MEYMYKNGIMNNEADGDDMPGFKGILARWLSKLVYEENQTKYFAWMEKMRTAHGCTVTRRT